MQSMAGGVMGQVQGLIPGMKKEEEVPDPAQVQEGEYQEYAVSAEHSAQLELTSEISVIFPNNLSNMTIRNVAGRQRDV